jgi:hypothetical protein
MLSRLQLAFSSEPLPLEKEIHFGVTAVVDRTFPLDCRSLCDAPFTDAVFELSQAVCASPYARVRSAEGGQLSMRKRWV